jgi:hypothetical protein
MTDTKYDTNLASEYYILSALYRQGFDAFVTLGNKKSIDIIVKHKKRQVTIDVKGLQGKTNFPVDNLASKTNPNHYIIFISFLDRINEMDCIPEIYIVPSTHVKKITYQNPKGNRRMVKLGALRKVAHKYQDNWKSLKA